MMNLTDKQIEEFNVFYNRATNSMQGLVILNDYRPKAVTPIEEKKIRESIYYFKEALGVYTEHFPSLFFIGKLHQRLGEYEKSMEALEEALLYEHKNHSLPLEAAIVAMHLGDIEKAIELSAESVRRAPNNSATIGNHAMNLVVAGRDEEAMRTIEQALAIDPADKINQNIKKKIESIVNGEEDRPSFKDLI